MDASALARDGWPCPTAAEMAAIDRDAIEVRGLPGRLLMENAGRALARAVRELAPRCRRPLVLCGAGNNGGDGFVIARVLREQDSAYQPVVLALGDPERRSEEARQNFELLFESGVEVVLPQELKELEGLLERADLVVDAVFGVGLARPVEGELARAFEAVNRSGRPVLAVDVPSGVSSETGEAGGAAVRSDWIVTLGLPTLGLPVRAPDAPVYVADIGLPARSLASAHVRQFAWTEAAAALRLPARPATGHKGRFGHVLVIAGSPGKTGAAVLAAEGALRSGAGLVTAAAPAALHDVFEQKLTECMSFAYDDGASGELVPQALPDLLAAAAARDVVALGPGLGQTAPTRNCVLALLEALEVPTVLDADGLNALEGAPELVGRAAPRILTPHPGEMARLLSCDVPAVQADRVGAARTLAERSGAVALLKGARTVIAAPDGRVWINPTGGPGLASGGSGDVLCGVVAALLGQGLDPVEAAVLGAYVHGRAGEVLGPVAVAGDVAAALPHVLATLRDRGADPGDVTLHRFP